MGTNKVSVVVGAWQILVVNLVPACLVSGSRVKRSAAVTTYIRRMKVVNVQLSHHGVHVGNRVGQLLSSCL